MQTTLSHRSTASVRSAEDVVLQRGTADTQDHTYVETFRGLMVSSAVSAVSQRLGFHAVHDVEEVNSVTALSVCMAY